MLKGTIIVLLLPTIAFAQLIDSDVLPFGGYSSRHSYDNTLFSDSCLSVMHHELGINQFTTGSFNPARAENFADSGIYPYPYGVFTRDDVKPQQKYSHSTYYVCHPDSCSEYSICCDTENGDVGGPDDAYWVWKGDGPMLANYWLKFENKFYWLRQNFKLRYYPYLKIAKDSTTLDDSTIVGWFTAEKVWDGGSEVRFRDTIRVGDLPQDTVFHDTLMALTDDSTSLDYFHIASHDIDSSHFVRLRFYTVDACTIFVDYLKVHCEDGWQLIDSSFYDEDIKSYTGDTDFEDKILGWMLKDTPGPQNYRPNAYIDSLIQEAMSEYGWTENPVRGHPWLNAGSINGWRDYVRIGEPEVIWAYLYPTDSATTYTGYSETLGEAWQSNLNYWVADPCDSIRILIDDFSSTTSWMYAPQYWWCEPDSGCTAGEWRRKPTPSELLCETYMGLCYHPIGIMFWKYDSGTSAQNQALVGLDGTHDPELYDPIKNDLNPYIKAIDSTYLQLNWNTAYSINYEYDFDPPSGSWIDTIYAVSNSSDPNPDLGWFHVGEYTEGSDKYVMLVNRACSKDEQGNPAPPITATVKFDPTNLGLGNYVYIIDIADSIFFTSYEPDSVWEDTTYSAKLNGTIPFTTVLGPGEGRLFKIIQTSQKTLSGDIDTQYKYQGKITVSGDITVPANETMEILGPARFELLRCDDQDGGADTSIVELIINGTLAARGTPNDSIIFYPDTLYNCDIGLLSNPQPGDWYGIYFKQGARGELEYCSVKYGVNGIEMRNSAKVDLAHCLVKDNETTGIYNYKGKLDADSCRIEDNPLYGIYSDRAESVVDSCHFRKNEKYAIYCRNNPTSGLDSTKITYCAIDNGGNGVIDSSSQYGIFIDGLDKARIYKCTIQEYNQGAVKLRGSDALVANNVFENNVQYGVFTEDLCFPKIRQCRIDDVVSVGVRSYNGANPDIGVNPADPGNCSFDDSSMRYFIYFDGLGVLPDTIWAQDNWYGSDRPDPAKFYTNSSFRTIMWEPYLTSPPPPPKLEVGRDMPFVFSLHHNYPNPFNPRTTIAFTLDAPAWTVVRVYNILGQRILTLTDKYLAVGEHSVSWDGKDESGKDVSSGVYFYTVQSGDHFASSKMTILR